MTIEIEKDDLRKLLSGYEWYTGYWIATEEEELFAEKVQSKIDGMEGE